MANNLEQEITPNLTHNVFVCRKCNKEYKARTSLWYHTKKCNGSNPIPLPIKFDNKGVIDDDKQETDTTIGDNICSDNNITITKNMFMELIKLNIAMILLLQLQDK